MAEGTLGIIDRQSDIRSLEGMWMLDDDDWSLIAQLCDPVYLSELLFGDPNNYTYSGTYHVRDYQYPLFRPVTNYQVFPCARDVGKTESIKARAVSHAFKRLGEDLLVTAPELLHLEGVTAHIENRITETRLTRDFLRTDAQRTGITHKPFAVAFADGTRILGRIPHITGLGVKSMHEPDLMIDECFPPGTLVLTDAGHIPIEQVKIGDRVLTHRGRWRKVTATAKRNRPTVRLAGQGHPGLVASENHPFWCRRAERRPRMAESEARRLRGGEMFEDGHTRAEVAEQLGVAWQSADKWYRKWVKGGIGALKARELKEGRRTDRSFDAPGEARFVRARDLAPEDAKEYWSSPCEFPVAALPEMPVGVTVNDDFWWLLGFYMAEGCVGLRADGALAQAVLSVHRDEVEMVQRRLASIGVESKAYDDRNSKGARVHLKGALTYRDWLVEHVGRLAVEHEVKPWLLGQSERVRRLVLDGYVTGDGNMVKDDRYAAGRWQATCADKKLVLSIKLLAQSLGYFVSLYWWTETRDPKAKALKGFHGGGGRGGWYQIRGNLRSQSAFVDDGKHFALVKRAEPTGKVETLYDLTVAEDHSFYAETQVCSNSQDYPANGWVEVHPTVIKDHTGPDGKYDFTYHAYGVHVGGTGGQFGKISTSGAFKVTSVTALQKPGWNKAEKEAAIAMYGGVNTPDYRRNILGEKGQSLSQFFVTARLMACMDQDKESKYNTITFKACEHQSEDLPSMIAADGDVGDILDLPDGLGQQVYGGMDVGLVTDPTVIQIWAVLPDAAKRSRLQLIRMFHLWRFTERQIRECTYRIARHYGLTLRAFGQDITGLGLPLYQAMESDEKCPEHLKEVSRGYVFNAKVPVSVDKNYVSKEGSQMVDQFGHIVEEVRDKWTGRVDLIARMTMIEASTRYLRGFVDPGFLLLPFHAELIDDFQGETEQRVRAMGGVKKKPNAFHMLDAARGMAMAYKAGEMEEQVYAKNQGAPVFDRAVGAPNVLAGQVRQG